jgi:hypothetical protein
MDVLNCSIGKCKNEAKIQGMCLNHYKHFVIHGDPEYREHRKCLHEECGNKAIIGVFCRKHHPRKSQPSKKIPCSIEGCYGEHLAKGYCSKHYQKFCVISEKLKRSIIEMRNVYADMQPIEFAQMYSRKYKVLLEKVLYVVNELSES